MYLPDNIKDIIIQHCIEEKDYIYIEKITYLNNKVSDFYLCIAIYFRYDFERRIKYAEIITIKNKSQAVCISYISDTNKRYIPINEKSDTPGSHCLFIIKEVAFIVLNYMQVDQLRFKVEDPKLANIYRSKKGFGKKLNVLENNTFYVNKETT